MPPYTMETGTQSRRGGIPSGYVNGHLGPSDMPLHPHQVNASGTAMQMQDEDLNALMNRFNAMNIPAGSLGQGGPAMHNLHAGAFVNGPDGSVVFATPYGPLQPVLADHAYGAAYPFQYPTGGYAPTYAPGAMVPFTPARPIAFSDRIPRELPGLENRRSSYSTSATESAPATPFYGNTADRLNGGTRVASVERSSFTTPSPRENAAYMASNHAKIAADPEIERLLMQEPRIPKAIPAYYTTHVKPLEQCLENRIQGNRNVYIRGLHPTTDDELLHNYAKRFGEVEQSKAIIDTVTGACKGFGFAKFKDVQDSQKCIRGFYRLGYEVGFARESFNARLKAEGDVESTNLYISNLPKDINESMLSQIFEPYHIMSSKILRDSMGNSRGVGFARFETRDICEKVIKTFHGMTVGQDNFVMQVRYADTPAQKDLKRITAERRQYRTNEYNIGAYGTHAVGVNPTIYTHPMWNSRGSSGYSHGSIHYPSHATPRPLLHATAVTNESVNASQNQDSTRSQQPTPKAVSDDSSGDEGATIVDRSVVADGSSPKLSSPEKGDA